MGPVKSILLSTLAAIAATSELEFLLGVSRFGVVRADETNDVELSVPKEVAEESEERSQGSQEVDLFGEGWKKFAPDFREFSDESMRLLVSHIQDMMRVVGGLGMEAFSPSFFGESSGFPAFPRLRMMKPKTSLKRVDKCRYIITWVPGVTAENVRVVLHLHQRQVEVQYRSATRQDKKLEHGESHSETKEQSSQSLSVDPECIMTREVVAQKLAGWTDNAVSAADGAPKKLLITFPSAEHVNQLIEEGHVPADALDKVLAGDFAGFNHRQMCMLSGRTPQECELAEGHEVQLEETPIPSEPSSVDTVDLPRFSHHNGEI